jgi:hypothetical protein
VTSPYEGLEPNAWPEKTQELIESFPLEMAELIEVVQLSWAAIFRSKIGPQGFRIGKDIFPKPQIVAFFLHELIPLELQRRYPGVWRPEETARDKDIVHIPDEFYSVEIKTSSHASQIFGNRSFAQVAVGNKKSKSGFYLAINFDKVVQSNASPCLRRIRFGWLDHSDWQGQAAATGQQARLSSDVERGKLFVLL